MRDRGIIDAFHIFRVFKVAITFNTNLRHDAYWVKESTLPRTLRGVYSGLRPLNLC